MPQPVLTTANPYEAIAPAPPRRWPPTRHSAPRQPSLDFTPPPPTTSEPATADCLQAESEPEAEA
jgi:hypothetical protein